MGDVLEHLPASVRNVLAGIKSSYPPQSHRSSAGADKVAVEIRTVDPAPPSNAELPSSSPTKRPSSRPLPSSPRPGAARSAPPGSWRPGSSRPGQAGPSSQPTTVELLVDLPPPGFDGPAENPHVAMDLPQGFDPEQLGVHADQRNLAAAQTEALRRSLQAPPLEPRRRKVNVGQLVIGILLGVLLVMLFILARLYLEGDLG
jgi:hypothetical protein